jgi:hypothetical protein
MREEKKDQITIEAEERRDLSKTFHQKDVKKMLAEA